MQYNEIADLLVIALCGAQASSDTGSGVTGSTVGISATGVSSLLPPPQALSSDTTPHSANHFERDKFIFMLCCLNEINNIELPVY